MSVGDGVLFTPRSVVVERGYTFSKKLCIRSGKSPTSTSTAYPNTKTVVVALEEFSAFLTFVVVFHNFVAKPEFASELTGYEPAVQLYTTRHI